MPDTTYMRAAYGASAFIEPVARSGSDVGRIVTDAAIDSKMYEPNVSPTFVSPRAALSRAANPCIFNFARRALPVAARLFPPLSR